MRDEERALGEFGATNYNIFDTPLGNVSGTMGQESRFTPSASVTRLSSSSPRNQSRASATSAGGQIAVEARPSTSPAVRWSSIPCTVLINNSSFLSCIYVTGHKVLRQVRISLVTVIG